MNRILKGIKLIRYGIFFGRNRYVWILQDIRNRTDLFQDFFCVRLLCLFFL